MTKEPISLKFSRSDFVEVAQNQVSSLFKLCAVKMGLDTEKSIKYQVVCDSTALIGVIKQKNKNETELESLERVQFGKQRAIKGD